jgi:hypothetical protein
MIKFNVTFKGKLHECHLSELATVRDVKVATIWLTQTRLATNTRVFRRLTSAR